MLGVVAGAFAAVGPAFAQGSATAQPAASASVAESAPRHGFFVGLQSGLVADSGLAPIVAGYQGNLTEEGRWSVTASGYYMYQTEWSLGTYLGGGLGAFNLPLEAAPGFASSQSSFDLGFQGMAGVTYQFSPTMTLGLEYRYLGGVDGFGHRNFDVSTLKDDTQSVSLRFDFAF